MHPRLTLLAVTFLLTLPLPAQNDPETAEAAARRVLDGGTFWSPKWRRGDDGMLQLEYFADAGDRAAARFVPLLGEDLVEGLSNCGVIGWLSLWCHGNGDLLAMTDAAFHLGCLGIDTSDSGLRQYLALPLPPLDGPKGRAELLDRLLAVDLLRQRGCRAAAVELRLLAGRAEPKALGDRATAALAALEGRTTKARQRLDPATLPLPPAYDGCLVIDHSRLPDLSWLTGFGRRLGMLVTARAVLAAGGSVSPAMCSGAQRFADTVGELPFGIALQYGNVRLDQSILVVTAKADADMPVAFGFAAAGEFEAERWQQARLPDDLQGNNPLSEGSLQITDLALLASSDGSKGKPRPEVARELLRDHGCAVFASIPERSRLWLALSFLGLPPSKGAEVQVSFGEVFRLEVKVAARDEDGADAWLGKGKELLAQGRQMLEQDPQLKALLQDSPELQTLVGAASGAKLSIDGDRVVLQLELRGFGRQQFTALLEKLPM